ncbi:hypothetical protein FQN54_000222 [Arachnomyces sp. PD_36]|nr:hypothetical protein FQN54_000222 [Arachnomyces sp. PD_36]
MGQKHNRRRIRPRSRNRINPQLQQQQDESQQLPPLALAQPIPLQGYQPPPSSYPTSSPHAPSSRPCNSSPVASAQRWHNRYTAWQSREEKQRREAAKIEEEQCRLFGGEPGDDVALCYRMLEYFGGLDYIDS